MQTILFCNREYLFQDYMAVTLTLIQLWMQFTSMSMFNGQHSHI